MALSSPIARLRQAALPSSDLDRSISFYRDVLGLRLVATFDPPGLAFFDLGPVRLLLERSHPIEPSSSVLYLEVPDLHRACEELSERGVSFSSPPHLIHRDEVGTFGPAGFEEWMAFFADPDGNKLALAWSGESMSSGS